MCSGQPYLWLLFHLSPQCLPRPGGAEAYSSPVQHCQKSVYVPGVGGREWLCLWGSIVFTVVRGLTCLCQWWRIKEAVSWISQSSGSLGDTAGSYSGTKVRLPLLSREAAAFPELCCSAPNSVYTGGAGGAWVGELLGWLKGLRLLEPKWGPLRLGGGHLLLLSLD